MAFTPPELRYLRSRRHIPAVSLHETEVRHYLECLFQRPIDEDEVVDYWLLKAVPKI